MSVNNIIQPEKPWSFKASQSPFQHQTFKRSPSKTEWLAVAAPSPLEIVRHRLLNFEHIGDGSRWQNVRCKPWNDHIRINGLVIESLSASNLSNLGNLRLEPAIEDATVESTNGTLPSLHSCVLVVTARGLGNLAVTWRLRLIGWSILMDPAETSIHKNLWCCGKTFLICSRWSADGKITMRIQFCFSKVSNQNLEPL